MDFSMETLLIELIDKCDSPIRRRKLENKVVFDCILGILKGWTWRDLEILRVCPSTVYMRFKSWVKKDVLKKAWVDLLEMYSVRKLKENHYHFKDLFINIPL